jgi:hypothetical protein
MIIRPATQASINSLVESSLPFKNSKMSNMVKMITKKGKSKNEK